MKIRILSLFSGCGGLDLGFAQEGHYEIVLALDADPVSIKTYNHNHGDGVAEVADLTRVGSAHILELIRERCGKKIHGVIGGPPCQPFSNGNRSTRSDGRSILPLRFAELLKMLNSENEVDFFVFENVKGISFEQHRSIFSQSKQTFEEAGFKLHEGLLDALDFGVPQRRPRVFVVGFNNKKFEGWDFKYPPPERKNPRTVGNTINHLPDPIFFDRKLTVDDIPYHPNHWTMNPKSSKFTDGSLREGQRKGRSFRVLSRDKPSWTVAYGNREVHVHPSTKRRLSVLEAMLLQGFPESYRLLGTLSDQIRQVCDAVPPPLAKALARQIWLFLQGDQRARAPATSSDQLSLL